MLVVGVTTLCMLSPGPDMVLVMRNTLTRDRRAGGLTALGVLTGNMVHIGYCVFGLALVLTQSPVLFDALRIAGALYLIYLGVQGCAAVAARSVTTRFQPQARGVPALRTRKGW